MPQQPPKEQVALQYYQIPVAQRRSAPQHRQRPYPYDVDVPHTRKPPVRQTEEDVEEPRTSGNGYPVLARNFQKAPIQYDYPQQPGQRPIPEPEQKNHHPWILWIGLALLFMLASFVLLSALFAWWQVKQDDWTYGNPRTFQTDANVGHYGRISHFICVNLQGDIQIVETQKGHPEATHIYTPNTISVNAEDPVTVSFQDVNGDGKPDMIVATRSLQAVLYNTGTSFQPQPPAPTK